MALPTSAIQVALVSRYRNDATLQGLLAGASPNWSIFGGGGVPTNQPFPYVTLYPITERVGTALAMGTDSVDSYVQITTFTQTGADGGMGQARNISARLYVLIQPPAPPLDLSASGFNQFFCLFESKIELSGPDGITQQIVMRFRLMTQG